MSDFYLKKGDLLPILQSELSDASGIIDLSTVTGVYFNYRPRYLSSGAIQRTGFVASVSGGIVEIDWVSLDTAIPGVYYGEWQIIFSNQKQITFPNDSMIIFEITENLI